ncbi:MAG TPA: hypothetical protein VFK52_10660 [Nocardioidaceae bacterium]|nr:hypothetical protein [Nocardioidaceae bacterium]
MRILDLQRRLREVGRIRIGQRIETTNKKGEPVQRPAKLEQFRLTSRDRVVIEAAVQQWGGVCQPWEGAPDGPQWEVYTSTDQVPVVIPPSDMAFSQAWEQWSGGGCRVRCDGQWDHLGDKACHCDPEDRACDPHTRLSVILPDLPGMGVWRLDTQSYYAAVELAGLVDLIVAHSARGVLLPARLRLEQRSVKRAGEQTKRFVVPVLDIDVHPMALAPGGSGELGTPVSLPGLPSPNMTPVPVQDGAGAPTIAEQLSQIDEDQPKAARVNAAAPIPATGIAPRTAVDAAAAEGITSEQMLERIVGRVLAKEVPGEVDQHAKAIWRKAKPKAPGGLIPDAEAERVLAEADVYLDDLAAFA